MSRSQVRGRILLVTLALLVLLVGVILVRVTDSPAAEPQDSVFSLSVGETKVEVVECPAIEPGQGVMLSMELVCDDDSCDYTFTCDTIDGQ